MIPRDPRTWTRDDLMNADIAMLVGGPEELITQQANPDEPLAPGYSTRIVPMVAMHKAGKPIALLVIGEAPGAEEDKTGEPFVGKSGRLLRTAYVDYWKLGDYADVYLTNVVRCRPPANRTPRPREVKQHLPFLESDVRGLGRLYKRVVILAVGATACKAFGSKSLSAAFKMQGAEMVWGGVPRVTFFATWHPAYILREAAAGSSLETHLACLHRYLTGRDFGTEVEITYATAPSRISHDGIVCLDIETYGCLDGKEQTQFHPAKSRQWDRVRPFRALVSCALSWNGGSAFYDLTIAAHRRALCSVLRQVQQDDAILLLQNAAFDLTFLRAFLPACRHSLVLPTRLADLMVSSYLVDEARPERSLKALSPLLIGQRGLYKDEWKSLHFSGHADPELARYNVADTQRTLECHRICRESYRRLYGPKTQKGSTYSDRWYSDLLHLVTWMSETGVPIDESRLTALDSHLCARKSRLESLGQDVLGLTLEGTGSDKSKRQVVSEALELLGSNDVASRIELTPTGKLPYDADTRALLMPALDRTSLGGREAWRRLHVLGLHQDVSKLLSTYTGPMLRGRKRAGKMDNSPRIINGRIYPAWYPVPREFGAGESGGTKQGRLSAKSPSVPTFPPCIKKLLLMDLWADYSQIELRVAALLSNDPVMVEEYNGTPDLHTRTAKLIFGDDIVNHPQFKSVYRAAGKSINFLMLYRGGAEKFRETVLAWTKLDYPLDRAYAAIERFWATYHGLRIWQDGLIAFAQEHGYYELPLTGQSRLFSRARPPINEVCNFPVQTIAANITLSAQFHLWRMGKEESVGMSCPVNIYDAIGIELTSVERSQHGTARAEELMGRILPNPPYFQDLCAHLGRTLPLAYEVTK